MVNAILDITYCIFQITVGIGAGHQIHFNETIMPFLGLRQHWQFYTSTVCVEYYDLVVVHDYPLWIMQLGGGEELHQCGFSVCGIYSNVVIIWAGYELQCGVPVDMNCNVISRCLKCGISACLRQPAVLSFCMKLGPSLSWAGGKGHDGTAGFRIRGRAALQTSGTLTMYRYETNPEGWSPTDGLGWLEQAAAPMPQITTARVELKILHFLSLRNWNE